MAPVTNAVTDNDHDGLLNACAAGDQQALHSLYTLEGASMLGVVQRIVRDRAAAEDIIHDAFVRIWTRAETFDAARGSARTWMFSVARHLALDHVRKHRREFTAGDEIDHHADPLEAHAHHSVAADHFDWQGHGELERCLAHLPPERRNCLFHAYVDGYSHQEIAIRSSHPLGTVKAWIKRSLAALRECLS